MEDEMITIRIYVATRFVGSKDYREFEVEREVWENLSEEEQEEIRMEYMWDMIDCWEEIL